MVVDRHPSVGVTSVGRGFVVGCDVARAPEGLDSSEFVNPPGFFGWIARHGFSSAPPIAGLLMRSATVSVNPNAGRELVDILILPELKDIELRDWKAYDEAVEAGYQAAMTALKESDLKSQCCTLNVI